MLPYLYSYICKGIIFSLAEEANGRGNMRSFVMQASPKERPQQKKTNNNQSVTYYKQVKKRICVNNITHALFDFYSVFIPLRRLTVK